VPRGDEAERAPRRPGGAPALATLSARRCRYGVLLAARQARGPSEIQEIEPVIRFTAP